MKFGKAFRYRAYPSPEQIVQCDGWSDTMRWLWNIANEQRVIGLAKPKCERKYPSSHDQQAELTVLRKENAWLAAVPRNVLDNVLIALDAAWQRCFAKLADAPRFKKMGRDVLNLHETSPLCFHLDDHDKKKRRSKRDAQRKAGYLHFPKLDGRVRLVVHRPLEGKPKTCALVRDGDRWFAVITCELTVNDPPPRTEPIVAIDRGIVHFGALSDGSYIKNSHFAHTSQKKLARTQRKLARKKKGSNNYKKQAARVTREHQKTRCQRHHHLHVHSFRLAKNHGTIVMEKLNVAGMMQGNCARSIADAGWSIFAGFCRYKLAWRSGLLDEVWAAYSSQTCSACGHVDAKSRRSQSQFVCTKCCHTENADINAAKVLLQRYETKMEVSARANRSGMPVEGELPEGARRSRKVGGKVVLRKVRRSSGASTKLRPSGRG